MGFLDSLRSSQTPPQLTNAPADQVQAVGARVAEALAEGPEAARPLFFAEGWAGLQPDPDVRRSLLDQKDADLMVEDLCALLSSQTLHLRGAVGRPHSRALLRADSDADSVFVEVAVAIHEGEPVWIDTRVLPTPGTWAQQITEAEFPELQKGLEQVDAMADALASGRFSDAVEHFCELPPAQARRGELVHQYVLAAQLADTGLADAVRVAERVLPDAPERAMVLFAPLALLGRTGQAEACLDSVERFLLRDAWVAFQRGRVRTLAGDPAGARLAFETSLERDPDYAPAVADLARLA